MSILANLEPKAVFHYFEEITQIPHTSYNEKALSDYCANFAKEHGLEYVQDEMGNVVIISPATEGYEEVEPIIIQGHLDMVGDKLDDCPINLETDPLDIYVDGDFVKARGTTLGGDDGVAIAYALAILDSKDIPHPRLEIVFTVSEEVGLLGAVGIDLSMCKGKRLLNIDCEEEGIFTAGCAGGLRACITVPVNRVAMTGSVLNFRFEGLKGGHSGVDIHRGRANGNVLVGRFLSLLEEKTTFSILSARGGSKDNVIPSNASFEIVIDEDKIAVVDACIKEFLMILSDEFGTADPDINLVYNVTENTEKMVLDEASATKYLSALQIIPVGVYSMSADLEGLVETSSNLGVVEFNEADFVLTGSIRSSIASAKKMMTDKFVRIANLLGGTIVIDGDYPSWPYQRVSPFRDLCLETYRKQYNEEPVVTVIHAGLECGVFAEKIPGMDCISMGPNLYDIHTPAERMSISSVQRVWEFVKALIAAK